MSIKRLFDAVERRGDIGRRVAALVLPISNRPRVTSSCAGQIGLREPGEQTSGANLASRDNVAHKRTLYDSGNAATSHPALSKAGPDIRYQDGHMLVRRPAIACSRHKHPRRPRFWRTGFLSPLTDHCEFDILQSGHGW